MLGETGSSITALIIPLSPRNRSCEIPRTANTGLDANCNKRITDFLARIISNPRPSRKELNCLNTSFLTIYPPTGLNYDQGDNFRDPYVFYDAATAKYYMLVSARKDVGGGNWKGVIAYYTSTNVTNWTYQDVLYDGGTDNFFMMETAEIFKAKPGTGNITDWRTG
ncbi:MAG: hypothetical protein EOP45_23510 [Sphingobacteriaceae bacterium]|nr:MAG: hypothetical protein EOP45_23510 [Sphingobacteriaceae bacterium]